MNGKDIFLGLKYVDQKYIEEAEFGTFPSQAETETSRKRKAFRRPYLLAAVIALSLLLVGCGVVYVLTMQDLKVGEREVQELVWDDEAHRPVDATVQKQVLTLSGIQGSPNYLAAKEWYDYKQDYDPDGSVLAAVWGQEQKIPEIYQFYNPYTQEMEEKIAQILQTYNLQPIHDWIYGQNSRNVLTYLGLDGVLLPDAPAKMSDIGIRATENGYLHVDFDMEMAEGEDAWPYHSIASYIYTPKELFNPAIVELNDTGDWQEQHYTTPSGYELLILRSPSNWYSWVFCDRGDAIIYLRLETIHQVGTDINGYQEVIETPMTDVQLKQALDCFDFSLNPKPGDPAVLEGQPISPDLVQTRNGYTVAVKDVVTDGFVTYITLGLTAPEDVDLMQYVNDPSEYALSFDSCYFMPLVEFTVGRGGGVSRGVQDDGDGKANTVDFVLKTTVQSSNYLSDTAEVTEGSVWNLYIKDLYVDRWNEELAQDERIWCQEETWNFEITIEEVYGRELEFVSKPITTSVSTGWDINGNDVFHDMTLTSLKLRTFSSDYACPDASGGLDFADYKNKKFPKLVLKDGSTIQLDGRFLPYADSNAVIPLDDIDHLVLMDGTKLYPTEASPDRVTDFELKVKSAVTDGRTARIILSLTVPDGMEMCKENCQYSVAFDNFGDHTILLPRDGSKPYEGVDALSEFLAAQEDGDGRENTVDIVYHIHVENDEKIIFAPGSQWTFHIEGMRMERLAYPEGVLTDIESLWSTPGVRNVEVTFAENTDTREIELLSEPLTFKAVVAGPKDPKRDVTMTSFKLTCMGAMPAWKDDIAGNLFDYTQDPPLFTYAVLTDGSRIPLNETDYYIGNAYDPIPLDEVAYVELHNGIKLYPQTP